MSNQLLSFQRVPVLEALSPDDRSRLERVADHRLFRRRQMIFREEERNECVYLLVSGRVKLLRCAPNGRELTLCIVNPAELFGECGLFDAAAAYGCSAEVIED